MSGRKNFVALTIILLFAFSAPAFAEGKIIYVDDDANGLNDGSSWENAYKFLQDALSAVAGSDDIWVAQGIYKTDHDSNHPTGTGDRNATFCLKNGLILKGGYAGAGAPDPNSRNIDLYRTILSGDLNGDDEPNFANNADNSYHIVTSIGINEKTVLDGLVVTAANEGGGAGMRSYASNVEIIDCLFTGNSGDGGGGMTNVDSNIILTGCKFVGNISTRDGGAMVNAGSNLTLNNCNFIDNFAPLRGGAIFGYENRLTLTDCALEGNRAEYGGAISSYGSEESEMTNCTFNANSAEWSGGGIYNPGGEMNLVDCRFTANFAKFGGGMSTSNVISFPTTLTNCTFTGNWVHADDGGGGSGGGIHNHGSSPSLVRCTFTRNSAEWGNSSGGAITNIFQSNPMLTNCTFSENSADYCGAIENSYNSSPNLTRCTFRGNSAEGGGVISNFENSNPKLNDCTLISNFAGWSAGIDNNRSNPTLDNCIFIANISSGGGCGGIDTYFGSPTITNCTFVENFGPYGGSIYCYESPGTTIANSILWGSSGTQLTGSAVVRYTNIKGGYPGIGNLNIDPCFADPGYWDPNGTPQDANDDFWVNGDYHLKSQAGRWDVNSVSWVKDEVTSLCIDAGDPASPIGLEPFPNGGIINMGAYGGTAEASKSYFGEPVCETIIAGDINGDCIVNFKDFAFIAYHWLEEY